MRSTIPAACASAAVTGSPVAAHLRRLGDARQSRQTLRARRARNDAELHLRLAHLRRRNGHAVMPGHRDLESAAERRAVNRHHDRLGAILDLEQHRVERAARLLPARDLLELADIGARDERASCADEHHRAHDRVGQLRGADRRESLPAHRG